MTDTPYTGCPEVSDPTLNGYISVIYDLMIKSFEPLIKQSMGIFLVYVMPLYWHYFSGFGLNLFLTRIYKDAFFSKSQDNVESFVRSSRLVDKIIHLKQYQNAINFMENLCQTL